MRTMEVDLVDRESRPADSREEVAVGIGAGLLGGIALAASIVIWDWVRAGHLAFELPMAATAWLFGLRHFSHDHYLAWPMVIGVALFVAYWALSGVAFAALSQRSASSAVTRSLWAGFGWGVANFIFFWYMLLPIARNGAPFRAVREAPHLFVAPQWTWILGFTLLGLVTAAASAALRATPREHNEPDEVSESPRVPVHRVA